MLRIIDGPTQEEFMRALFSKNEGEKELDLVLEYPNTRSGVRNIIIAMGCATKYADDHRWIISGTSRRPFEPRFHYGKCFVAYYDFDDRNGLFFPTILPTYRKIKELAA